ACQRRLPVAGRGEQDDRATGRAAQSLEQTCPLDETSLVRRLRTGFDSGYSQGLPALRVGRSALPPHPTAFPILSRVLVSPEPELLWPPSTLGPEQSAPATTNASRARSCQLPLSACADSRLSANGSSPVWRRYASGICRRRFTPSFRRSVSQCALAVRGEI